MHRGRGLGLHRQAGGYGPAAVTAARMAVPVTDPGPESGSSGAQTPATAPRPDRRPASGGQETDAAEGRVNILLVDDKPANLVALEAMLQGLGQNLIRAESGREALKWLAGHDCAVI